MSSSISTYQVKKRGTLESIAKELEIPAEVLRRYHNSHCDLMSLIGNDLHGVHEICIPPHDRIAELKESQKNSAFSSKLLPVYLNPRFYAPDYEVSERFEQQAEEDVEINYLASLQLFEMRDKSFIAEVETSGFRKNGQASDDKISLLSQACMESIAPVSFVIPAQGKIKRFADHTLIVRKFENKRPDLEDFFIGEVSEAYFNKFHRSLKNEDYLLKQFRSALLYQVLFPEMDWFRRTMWEGNFYFTVNSFPVKCRFKAEHNHDNPDNVEIIISGNIIDSCSLQELIRGAKFEEVPEDNATGEMEIKYTINKVTKQLVRTDAAIVLWHEGDVYSKHTLTLVKKARIKN
jgi:hypothetical protein